MVSRDPATGSHFDLSDRLKLRLTGADRFRFVNGQITNDVRRASDRSAIAACVLNAKGKMNGHLFLSLRDDAVLIDADIQLAESLGPRLERYVISDDVEIEDVTTQFSIFHLLAEPPEISSGWLVSVNRFGVSGCDLWVPAAAHDQTSQLLSAGLPLCDRECTEVFRIEQGIPIWGRELTEDTIPVEANLEQSCIDYEKGCYIGQEIISRMKMSGQRNKSLFGLTSTSLAKLLPGMKLHPVDESPKEAGWITSATWSDRLGKYIALGYVKRPFDRAGSALWARADEGQNIPVDVVKLPFSSAVR